MSGSGAGCESADESLAVAECGVSWARSGEIKESPRQVRVAQVKARGLRRDD